MVEHRFVAPNVQVQLLIVSRTVRFKFLETNWNLRSYSKEEFIDAWKNSNSYSDVLRKLNKSISSNSIKVVRETGTSLGLSDISYTRTNLKRYSLSDILVKNSSYKGDLRKRLVTEGLLDDKCSAFFCPFKDRQVFNPFTGEETTLILALDHIDGDNSNNEITNLRILCTHCHSLTETWCGKNKERLTYKGSLPDKTIYLCSCGNSVNKYTKSGMCVKCSSKIRGSKNEKISWPSNEDLLDLVEKTNYTQAGRQLGVSDNAIRKRLKQISKDV